MLSKINPAREVAALRPGKLGVDDVVDALACLTTAYRLSMGKHMLLPPGSVFLDERALRMEMVA